MGTLGIAQSMFLFLKISDRVTTMPVSRLMLTPPALKPRGLDPGLLTSLSRSSCIAAVKLFKTPTVPEDQFEIPPCKRPARPSISGVVHTYAQGRSTTVFMAALTLGRV